MTENQDWSSGPQSDSTKQLSEGLTGSGEIRKGLSLDSIPPIIPAPTEVQMPVNLAPGFSPPEAVASQTAQPELPAS